MPDPITLSLFLSEMKAIHQTIESKHASLRQSMEEGFRDLECKLENHIKDDDTVADRVLVIETERKEEARQIVKRSGLLALLASAGLTGVIRIIEKVWK